MPTQFGHALSRLTPRTGLRIVTHVPADDATAEAVLRFDELEPRPIA